MKYVTAGDAIRFALGKDAQPTDEGGTAVSLGYCYMIAGIAFVIGAGAGMILAPIFR